MEQEHQLASPLIKYKMKLDVTLNFLYPVDAAQVTVENEKRRDSLYGNC